MSKTRCPNCDCTITIEKPKEGAVIVCSSCGIELEIVKKDPLMLDFTGDWQEEQEEENW